MSTDVARILLKMLLLLFQASLFGEYTVLIYRISGNFRGRNSSLFNHPGGFKAILNSRVKGSPKNHFRGFRGSSLLQ